MGPGRLSRPIVASALVLGALAVAVGSASAAVPTAIRCPFDPGSNVRATCATLRVPLAHARPRGRSITIAYTRLHWIPSPGAARRTPAIFLNGGPGNATLVPIAPLGAISPALRRADLIFVDQRGTGLSRPRLNCPEVARARVGVLERPGDPVSEARRVAAAAGACARRLRRLGVQPGAYNTAENAADIDTLRRALRLGKVDLIAPSYGSALAFAMIRAYPGAIRAVVIDSPWPLDKTGIATNVGAFDRPATPHAELLRLLDACAASPACRPTLPDPRAALRAIGRRFDAAPAAVGTTGPDGRRLALHVSGEEMLSMLARRPSTTANLPGLPALVRGVADGDPGAVTSLVTDWVSGYARTPLNARNDIGMSLAVNCWDRGRGATLAGALRYIRRRPATALDVMDGSDLACQAWGGPRAPRSFNRPVASRLPTLFMSGEFDALTPPAWAREARRRFPRSRWVRFGGLSHAALYSLCGQDVASAFLAHLGTAPSTACVDPLGRIAFTPRP